MSRCASGPPRDDLPYRWGCVCGAVWNTETDASPSGALCGPFCKPSISPIRPAYGTTYCPCGGRFQQHPMSDDLGVCAECGNEWEPAS
jgi:hypothetical protein